MTTRQIRQSLFSINSPQADDLRVTLFAVEDQDSEASADAISAYEEVLAASQSESTKH